MIGTLAGYFFARLLSPGVMIYDTPVKIREFKIRCVYYALLWQQRGRPLADLGIRRGVPTPLQVLRRDYNFKGRKVEDGLAFCECLLINKTY